MLRTSSIHVFDHFDLYLTLTFNLSKNVSNGSFPPQGQQLCQIVLKSMHYLTSYGPNKFGRTHGRTHIHGLASGHVFIYMERYITSTLLTSDVRTHGRTHIHSLASGHVFIYMERYITSTLLTSRHFITCP